MGKLVSKVRQARLVYQAQIGRPVTVKEVADNVGTTRSYLSLVEHGKAWPKEDLLANLCAFYGINVGDLYSYEPGPDSNENLSEKHAQENRK